MTDYTKATDFAAKDSLPSGDSGKVIKGTEFETEFDAIATAIGTKADKATPTFTGDVTITTGSVILSSGEGIDFSGTADGSGTTSSEVFDDYEEGTFTPVVTTSAGSGTITYITQTGHYTKIGNICYVAIELNVSSFASRTGAIKIEGLPFSVKVGVKGGTASLSTAIGFAINAGESINGNFREGEATIDLLLWDVTTGASTLDVTSDTSGSMWIYLSGTYVTA